LSQASVVIGRLFRSDADDRQRGRAGQAGCEEDSLKAYHLGHAPAGHRPTSPDLPAFKRLLLVAEDVAFIDRPSMTRHRAEGRSPNASLVADGKPLWTNSTFGGGPIARHGDR